LRLQRALLTWQQLLHHLHRMKRRIHLRSSSSSSSLVLEDHSCRLDVWGTRQPTPQLLHDIRSSLVGQVLLSCGAKRTAFKAVLLVVVSSSNRV
jgi:hypothetical protein